jgi:molybdopterin molybdotransferase
MKEFLKTISYMEWEKLLDNLEFENDYIISSVFTAQNHISFEDIYSEEDIPGFSRSTVDGYAVKSEDVKGASASIPSVLKIIGEITMGEISKTKLKHGEAIKISTGGAIPEGADSVIMIENCEESDDWVEIYSSVGKGENIILFDEDYGKGEIIVKKGELLNNNGIQALIASGIYSLKVYEKIKIAIISTGDEIIDYKAENRDKGKIRDTNSFVLSGILENINESISFLGIIKDNYNELYNIIEKNLNKFDLFLISGGSSMGTRDITYDVLSKFSEILFHGMRVSPGKPVIFGKGKNKIFVGLPGHPLSSFISAYTVVLPLVLKMEGGINYKITPSGYLSVDRNLSKKIGRESFIPSKKYKKDNRYFVRPLLGESGLISLIKESTGFIRISENKEGVYEGEEVEYYEV